MKFRYTILPDQQLILKEYRGPVALADVIENTRRLWADTRYRPDFAGLCDLRAAATEGRPEDIGPLCEFLQGSALRSRGPWAVVISNPLVTALAMLFINASPDGPKLALFSTWSAACEYLDIQIEEQWHESD